MYVDTWAVIGAVVLIILVALICVFTLVIMRIQGRRAAVQFTQLFLEQRRRGCEVEAELPINYRELSAPETPEHRHVARQYWLHLFDEWMACRALSWEQFRALWETHYVPYVANAMAHDFLYAPLVELLSSRDTLHPWHAQEYDAFARELERIRKAAPSRREQARLAPAD